MSSTNVRRRTSYNINMKICVGLFVIFAISDGFFSAENNSTENRNTTLRFVHILFRHGKRSPIIFFDDDPNSSFWVDGPGQLTKEGKQDSYHLGQWFRNRYSHFLSDYVHDKETYAQSTDNDRTINTAQLFTAGLYPPKDAEIWDSDLGSKWQPFPVHVPPVSLDPFYYGYTKNHCPQFLQLLSLVEKTPEATKVYNDNKQLVDLFANKSGDTQRTIGFLDTSDTIAVELIHNLKPPKWLSQHDAEKLQELISYFTFTQVKTQKLTQLNGGYLIRTMMDRMLNATKHPTQLKVQVYSAHDYTIMFLLSAMKMFNFIMPPFSAAVIIELHENTQGNYFLKVLYRNDTNYDPYVLNFPSCPDMCPWQQAWDATKDNFVEDLTKSCMPLDEKEMAAIQKEMNAMFP